VSDRRGWESSQRCAVSGRVLFLVGVRPRPSDAESCRRLPSAARDGDPLARRRSLPASAERPFVVHIVGVVIVDQPTAGGSWNDVEFQVRVRRVQPALRHVVEPVPTQTDPPQRRRGTRQAVPALPQSLRLDACAIDAPPHPRPQVSMLVVRQGVLAAVASAWTRAIPYGREGSTQVSRSSTGENSPYGREAVHVCSVWKGVR